MFTFEPGVILWTLVSFAIAYFVIGYVVYPRIRDIMDKRKNAIETSIREAEKLRSETKEIQEQIDNRLRSIKLEELRIISEAKEKARKISEEFEKKAQEEFRQLRLQKEQELSQIENSYFQSSRKKIAELIMNACEKTLKAELTQEQQQKILTERIEELEGMLKK